MAFPDKEAAMEILRRNREKLETKRNSENHNEEVRLLAESRYALELTGDIRWDWLLRRLGEEIERLKNVESDASRMVLDASMIDPIHREAQRILHIQTSAARLAYESVIQRVHEAAARAEDEKDEIPGELVS